MEIYKIKDVVKITYRWNVKAGGDERKFKEFTTKIAIFERRFS
jgi:hypothetical protein